VAIPLKGFPASFHRASTLAKTMADAKNIPASIHPRAHDRTDRGVDSWRIAPGCHYRNPFHRLPIGSLTLQEVDSALSFAA